MQKHNAYQKNVFDIICICPAHNWKRDRSKSLKCFFMETKARHVQLPVCPTPTTEREG